VLWIGNRLKATARHFRTTLIAGLLVIVPVGVTFLILKFVFDFLDPLLKPVFEEGISRYTPGMGIAALLIIIYLVGLVAAHVVGKRIVRLANNLVERIPVVNVVYKTARQAADVFSTSNPNGNLNTVVLVDFPGNGLKSIGLVTARMKDQDGNPLIAVYLPTTPFPTSGFLVFLPESMITYTDMTVDDAMKLILSAGIIAPDRINSYPNPPADSVPGQAPFKAAPTTIGFPFQAQGRAGQDHSSDNSSQRRASNQ